MGKITSDDSQLLDAVIVWTGYGISNMPSRQDNDIIIKFGNEKGQALLNEVLHYEEAFYESKAYIIAVDLPEMAKNASCQFKQRFPNLPKEIATAFAWCYTFDYR